MRAPKFEVVIAAQHPARPALHAEAKARGISGRLIVAEAIEEWAIAWGGGDLIVRTKPPFQQKVGPLPARAVEVRLGVRLRDAARWVCRHLGLSLTQGASCAMAWRFGIPAGTYAIACGRPLVVEAHGIPGDGRKLPAEGALAVEGSPGQQAKRDAKADAKREAQAAHAAFVARRVSASELPGRATLLNPRPLPTPKEIEDRARRTIPGWKPTKTVEPVPAPVPEPKRVVPAVILPPPEKSDHVCRYCKTRPMASLKEQSAHGACSTCWTASLDRRIADGLMPRQSVEARVAWLTEQGGVTTRQAAVWSGLARQAEGRLADVRDGRRSA